MLSILYANTKGRSQQMCDRKSIDNSRVFIDILVLYLQNI